MSPISYVQIVKAFWLACSDCRWYFPSLFPVTAMLSTETNSLNLILMKIKLPVQTVASRFAGLRSNSLVKLQRTFPIIVALLALLALPADAAKCFFERQ